MTATARSEPMRTVFKMAFVNRFKNHPHNFLYKFVLKGRDAQRTLLSILFGNVNSVCRTRTVTLVLQPFNDSMNVLYAHSVYGLPVCAFRIVARILRQLLIGKCVQIFIEQQSVKPFKLVIRILAVPSQTV